MSYVTGLLRMSSTLLWVKILVLLLLCHISASRPVPCMGLRCDESESSTPTGNAHRLSSLSNFSGRTPDYVDSQPRTPYSQIDIIWAPPPPTPDNSEYAARPITPMLNMSPAPMGANEYIKPVTAVEYAEDHRTFKTKILTRIAQLWRETAGFRQEVKKSFKKLWNWFLDVLWGWKNGKDKSDKTKEWELRMALIKGEVDRERHALGLSNTPIIHHRPYSSSSLESAGPSGPSARGSAIVPSDVQTIDDMLREFDRDDDAQSGYKKGTFRRPAPKTPTHEFNYFHDDDNDPGFGGIPATSSMAGHDSHTPSEGSPPPELDPVDSDRVKALRKELEAPPEPALPRTDFGSFFPSSLPSPPASLYENVPPRPPKLYKDFTRSKEWAALSSPTKPLTKENLDSWSSKQHKHNSATELKIPRIMLHTAPAPNVVA